MRYMVMELNESKIDKLKGRDPFRVPTGYFEGFTEKMICRLPEKNMFMQVVPAKQATTVRNISFYDRIKPWLYMAAAFAGLIMLFDTLKQTAEIPLSNNGDKQISVSTFAAPEDDSEGIDFLTYIEDLYAVLYMDDWYE